MDREWIVDTLKNLIGNVENGCNGEFILDILDEIRINVDGGMEEVDIDDI